MNFRDLINQEKPALLQSLEEKEMKFQALAMAKELHNKLAGLTFINMLSVMSTDNPAKKEVQELETKINALTAEVGDFIQKYIPDVADADVGDTEEYAEPEEEDDEDTEDAEPEAKQPKKKETEEEKPEAKDQEDDEVKESVLKEAAISIGKTVKIKQFSAASNRKEEIEVKIIDYVKKSGGNDIVHYDYKGKKSKLAVGAFKKRIVENSNIKSIKEENKPLTFAQAKKEIAPYGEDLVWTILLKDHKNPKGGKEYWYINSETGEMARAKESSKPNKVNDWSGDFRKPIMQWPSKKYGDVARKAAEDFVFASDAYQFLLDDQIDEVIWTEKHKNDLITYFKENTLVESLKINNFREIMEK